MQWVEEVREEEEEQWIQKCFFPVRDKALDGRNWQERAELKKGS